VVLTRTPVRAGAARRLRGPAAALLGVAVSWAAVALVDPGDGGASLCPWRTLTGLDCPFCGATRAAASLARGDVVEALDHNALLVLVVLPLAAIAWVRWTRRSWQGRATPVTNRSVAVLGAITLAWWILRWAVPWLGSAAAG
jgi:hypothetical protein